MESSLCRGKACDGHAEGAATDIVQANLVAKGDARRVASMLATDAHRHFRPRAATEANTHFNELAHAVAVEMVEGIFRQNALLGILDQELGFGIIAADARPDRGPRLRAGQVTGAAARR